MNTNNEQTDGDQETDRYEVLSPSAVESLTRGEYDVSIATAKRYPRSIKAFLARAESLATATPEIAASCEYAKPVGGGKVKGPSARLAEIVAASYGNIRVQARIISETNSQVVAQGVAHDLETNVAQSTEVTVSLLKKNGSRVGADQVATMCAAACAKARRNATFLVVPLAIIQPIIAAARRVVGGEQATLPVRRTAMLDWFEKKGVKRSAMFGWLGVKGEEDIGLEEMADLHAAQNTAKEEGADMAAVFGRPRESSRFSDDAAPVQTGKQALDAATQEAERREAEKAPVITHEMIKKLSDSLDDNRLGEVLDALEIDKISTAPADRLTEIHAALIKAGAK